MQGDSDEPQPPEGSGEDNSNNQRRKTAGSQAPDLSGNGSQSGSGNELPRKVERWTEAQQPPPPPPPVGDYQSRFEEEAKEFGSDAYVMKRIEALKEAGMPAALLLGVRTTGKTWLMQRIKKRLENDYTCKPRMAITDERLTGDEVQALDQQEFVRENRAEQAGAMTDAERAAADERSAASDTRVTESILVHRFLADRDDLQNFALIDVPGESVQKLADENYSAQRGLLKALEYANVIIIALPADVVLFGDEYIEDESDTHKDEREGMRDDARLTSSFADGLANIAFVRSLIRHERIEVKWKDPLGPPDKFDELVTPDAVEQHRSSGMSEPIGGYDGMDCPAFFALTKADRVFAALDILPDAAGKSPRLEKKFRAANERLSATPTGQVLQELFEASALHPDNRPYRRDFVSRLLGMVFGAKTPVAQISNPPELVRERQLKLFTKLSNFFPMSRFDLISAFYGNTEKALQIQDFNRLEAIGVDELVEWLGEVNSHGINEWHVWARNAFRRIYPPEKGRSPYVATGRFETSKRLRFVPAVVLEKMFSKEWHVARILPLMAMITAAIFTIWSAFDLTEDTGTYANSERYEEFRVLLDGGSQGDASGLTLPALAALPPIPDSVDRASAAEWSPIDGLKAWDQSQDGGYAVRSEYGLTADTNQSTGLAGLRLSQRAWQDEYVCGLEGWSEYRPIVRKAVINGYGDCGALQVAALRSPAFERAGPLGILMIFAGIALTIGAGMYWWWFTKTRSAFAWLYHSRAATTRDFAGSSDEQ